MAEIPHDVDDLRLAPVALHVDGRLEELGCLDHDELTQRIALDANMPDWDEPRRRDALLVTIARDVDLGGWEISWDPRGLRLSHGVRHVVLGVPATVDAWASRPADLSRS